MMKRVLFSVAAAGALMLSGCGGGGAGSNALVQPKTNKPTGSVDKLKTSLDAFEKKDSPLAKSLEKLDSIDTNALMQKTNLKINPSKGGAGKLMRITGEDAPDCVIDNINMNDDQSSINGTLKFNNCEFDDGVKINGEITVNYNATHTDSSANMNYSGSVKMDFSYDDIVIHIDEARTEGTESMTQASNLYTSSSENRSGITAYLKQGNTKLLILDGMNGDFKSNMRMTEDSREDSFEFGIQGFFGSDEAGMFEVATPERVKGDSANECPTEGKITITDADGKQLTITSNGHNMIVSDGSDTSEYPCDD